MKSKFDMLMERKHKAEALPESIRSQYSDQYDEVIAGIKGIMFMELIGAATGIDQSKNDDLFFLARDLVQYYDRNDFDDFSIWARACIEKAKDSLAIVGFCDIKDQTPWG